MSDLLIKRKEVKPELEAKIEVELTDGAVQEVPITITQTALIKVKKMIEDVNVGSDELMEFIKYDFIGIPNDFEVSDDEAMNAFNAISEHMGNREQRRNKRFQR